MTYWVAVDESKSNPYPIIEDDEPTKEKYPDYDYMIGPFTDKKLAAKESKTHIPATQKGFRDPFCNNGGGR